MAHCEKTPIVPKKKNEERSIESEYKSKLSIGEKKIPDPLNIDSGWIKEKEGGMTKWPSMYYQDMSRFVNLEGKEFLAQMDREYKLGKSYTYFADNLVGNILYKDIDSDLCFLKTEVGRSQAMRKKSYKVWAVLTKDKDDESPGGEILKSYCECLAGLSGVCNHLVGMLFKVENAVTKGLTKPSKTSLKSTWNDRSGGRGSLVLVLQKVWFFKSNTTTTFQTEI